MVLSPFYILWAFSYNLCMVCPNTSYPDTGEGLPQPHGGGPRGVQAGQVGVGVVESQKSPKYVF
jgi:hypothetical protein